VGQTVGFAVGLAVDGRAVGGTLGTLDGLALGNLVGL
jgi:hypothetical protein